MTRQMFMRLISAFRGEERSFDYGPHTGARYDVCGGPFPADRWGRTCCVQCTVIAPLLTLLPGVQPRCFLQQRRRQDLRPCQLACDCSSSSSTSSSTIASLQCLQKLCCGAQVLGGVPDGGAAPLHAGGRAAAGGAAQRPRLPGQSLSCFFSLSLLLLLFFSLLSSDLAPLAEPVHCWRHDRESWGTGQRLSYWRSVHALVAVSCRKL